MAVVNRSAKRFTWVKGRVYPVVVGVDLTCFQIENTVLVRLCPILEGTVWTKVMSTLHVAMYLFSKRSQMTSKCGKKIKKRHTRRSLTDVLIPL